MNSLGLRGVKAGGWFAFINDAMHRARVWIALAVWAAAAFRVSRATAGEPGTNWPPPVVWTAAQDHQNMMDQLGIKHLRPGADGFRRTAPNYRNTDESKANPYPWLPEVLRLDDGQPVTTARMWWDQRRPEIAAAFDREVYGRVPARVPGITWRVSSEIQTNVGGISVVTRQVAGLVDDQGHPDLAVTIPFSLTTPASAAGPVPVMIDLSFGHWGGLDRRPGASDWQRLVLARGWGYVVLVPAEFQADSGGGLTRGIIGLCNHGQPRRPEDWGALRAWAWGASRVLDYLETDPAVDAKQTGIEGLSRYGKAALVAMAYDQRFAIGLIGSSGEGGAKLSRRNYGELVENLTGTGEYHWMAGNFLKYGGPLKPGDLPVDAHELIALCAPRPTFISYGATGGAPGAEGPWLDQHGSFMAAVAAGPVYRLLGKKDLGTAGNYLSDPMPPVNTALTGGELAWRQHDGGHTDGPNWPAFLQWAARYIHPRGATGVPAGRSTP